MEKGLMKLYKGDFTTMIQNRPPDGSVIITLTSTNYPETYKFRVKDLYGPDEEVLEHEVIQPGPPEHIRLRMEEAKNARAKD